MKKATAAMLYSIGSIVLLLHLVGAIWFTGVLQGWFFVIGALCGVLGTILYVVEIVREKKNAEGTGEEAQKKVQEVAE